MALACQKDSYLQSMTATVVSCSQVEFMEENEIIYAVELDDTILFPEGGGQPEDRGIIDDKPVNSIRRMGEQVFHYMEEPLTVGQEVLLTVDWERRFDHMQQHTGQHLITAVAETMFSLITTSWNLGPDISSIELNTPSITQQLLNELESELNAKILQCIPVSIHLYEKDASELSDVRARLDLPEDHVGPVRVVNIEGIDSNTCCGTHVKNISELQMIKLLYTEKGKKNKTNLYFVVGNRILRYLEDCTIRERTLNSLLGSNSENVIEIVTKLQKSMKSANKHSSLMVRELASAEAKLYKLMVPKPTLYCLHKKNVDADFITVFLAEVADKDLIFFITVSDAKTGQFVLTGPEHVVEEYGPRINKILDGKGAYKNARHQGKFNKLSKIQEAENLLKDIENTM